MDADPTDSGPSFATKSYALSGKIMLSAIVVLFFVVILMICLHLYARWYLLRARRRQARRARNRRTNLVFYADPANPNTTTYVAVPRRGLDAAILKSLPVFVYSPNTHLESIECAVCLSEFEENEKVRTLPKCKHSFHIECIDMWFHSHSTCPLCRSPVEPVPQSSVQLVSPSNTDETDLCVSCRQEGEHVGPSTSANGELNKPRPELVGVTIEVPRRNGSFGDESAIESPASQGFRSPMSRMLSFTRILSRERRGNNLSPRSANPTSCESVSEVVDLERGREEARQNRA